MKHLLKLVWLMLLGSVFSGSLLAADLIVRENAIAPEFSTISSAIAAASDGDRILIFNKSGNVPYTENVVVDKALTFLPAECPNPGEDSCFFYVDGNWGIDLAPNSFRLITIIGMHNLGGNINNLQLFTIFSLNVLKVHNSWFEFGAITNNASHTRTEVTNCYLPNGGIDIRNGFIAGNIIGGDVGIFDGFVGNAFAYPLPSEYYIIGNRFIGSNSALIWGNDESEYIISNNFFLGTNDTRPIEILDVSGGQNYLTNNTIVMNSNNLVAQTGIFIENQPNVKVWNNMVISQSNNDIGIATGATANPSYDIQYNFLVDCNTNISGSGYLAVSNDTTSTVFYDTTTGYCLSQNCLDAGTPDINFYDLDRTRNDVGSGGGWFHPDNYFPLFEDGPKIWFLDIPTSTIQGDSISVKAEAFDN